MGSLWRYRLAIPRLARVVVSSVPHHITQGGNRRQQTFFCDEDAAAYIALMPEWCRPEGVEVWAYCLMPNHVHLVAVPSTEESLRHAPFPALAVERAAEALPHDPTCG